MCPFHENGDAVDLKNLIIFLLLVKTQHIGKPGTTAPSDAHAQTVGFGNLLFLADGLQLTHGAFGQ